MIDLSHLKRKKGSSPVIAIILMIAVAIMISVMVFIWSTGSVSERGTPEQPHEKVVIEELNLSGTNLTVYIRNMSTFDSVLDVVYVNGQMRAANTNTEMIADAVTILDLSAIISSAGGDGAFYVGDTVQLITERGNVIRFSLRY